MTTFTVCRDGIIIGDEGSMDIFNLSQQSGVACAVINGEYTTSYRLFHLVEGRHNDIRLFTKKYKERKLFTGI